MSGTRLIQLCLLIVISIITLFRGSKCVSHRDTHVLSFTPFLFWNLLSSLSFWFLFCEYFYEYVTKGNKEPFWNDPSRDHKERLTGNDCGFYLKIIALIFN